MGGFGVRADPAPYVDAPLQRHGMEPYSYLNPLNA